jgi:hypothetical protein
MRSIPVLALIFALNTSMMQPPDPQAAIRASAVKLDPNDPARTRLGALRFLGGWRLTSAHPAFGGISALRASKGRFIAIADTGAVIRFRMGEDGAPADSHFSFLPAGPGTGRDKSDRDAEAMLVDERNGAIWVAFERHNAIWRYAPGLDHAQAHAAPPVMKNWPWNGGPEAMVRLANGRFVLFGEDPPGPKGTTEAYIFRTDPARRGARPLRFYYRPPEGFAATDAALLPDGGILVLNRHFSLMNGVAAALTLVDPAQIARNRIVEGRFVARLAPPLTVDNMEALAVEREGGRTILWIASDDNFNPLQRTLLLKFVLDEEALGPD